MPASRELAAATWPAVIASAAVGGAERGFVGIGPAVTALANSDAGDVIERFARSVNTLELPGQAW